MGQWTNDLRRRQQAGDVGLREARAAGSSRASRSFVMITLMLVGLVLNYLSPLPGLGVFVFTGGLLGLGMTAAAGRLTR